MEECEIVSWNEFEQKIQALEIRRKELCTNHSSPSEYLFRGHGDSAWHLESTLDRFFSRRLTLGDYYRLALIARPRVEAFTNMRWDIPSWEEYGKWLRECGQLSFHDFKAYDYLVYLRHHGFPSPLLDWTTSPYVACFFAFRSVPEGASHVAVYVYQERSGVGKISSSDAPIIHARGPYVSTHKRHFLQQCQYTFCTEVVEDSVIYGKHEDVVAKGESQQDLFWTYQMPISERRQVLGELHRMNINAFSLFGSEDSLVEAIATSEIYVQGRDL